MQHRLKFTTIIVVNDAITNAEENTTNVIDDGSILYKKYGINPV